jgi:beta-glucanase (GH16 family)
MDRRSILKMTGFAALAATVPLSATAHASPADRVSPPTAPPPDAAAPSYIFQDEFDGPAGSGPDLSKWLVVNYDEPVTPPIESHYRSSQVFLDGNSNLVIRAAKQGDEYLSGRIQGLQKVGIGHTFEARLKFDCLTPGCWPAYWLLNQEPKPDGEVDVVEWYGNGRWAPGSTVHGRSDGKTWAGRDIPELVDGDWHNWRVQWDESGFRFWRDFVDGMPPYATVKPQAVKVYPFNQPGYLLFPIFNVAVGGPGGGDPNLGNFPADMLVDWIRIW